MRARVHLAGFASFDVDLSPSSVGFALRSPVSFAAASREFLLRLFEWPQERLSEIHADARSVSVVVRWRTAELVSLMHSIGKSS